MIGKGVRETYENGTGFPTFLVVNQDATGHAKEIALGLAKALGSTKAGAIEVTFNDETYLDLMSEQAIWPLIMNVFVTAFDFYQEKGLPAEAVLTEMYMSKEPMVMMEKMADMGLFKQLPLHSRTSQYGQMSRFKMVDNTSMRAFIEEQYDRIVDGLLRQGVGGCQGRRHEGVRRAAGRDREAAHLRRGGGGPQKPLRRQGCLIPADARSVPVSFPAHMTHTEKPGGCPPGFPFPAAPAAGPPSAGNFTSGPCDAP